MSKSTFTILFYARKNQVNRSGKIGIMIRVTVNGESVQFSSKLDIDPELWDATCQKMIGVTKVAREFNVNIRSNASCKRISRYLPLCFDRML